RASAGVGSGILNSARQVGVSVGLAVIGSLGVAASTRAWDRSLDVLPAAARLEAASLVPRVGGGGGRAGAVALGADAPAPAFARFLAGYRVALWAAGVVLVAAAIGAFAGMSRAEDEVDSRVASAESAARALSVPPSSTG